MRHRHHTEEHHANDCIEMRLLGNRRYKMLLITNTRNDIAEKNPVVLKVF